MALPPPLPDRLEADYHPHAWRLNFERMLYRYRDELSAFDQSQLLLVGWHIGHRFKAEENDVPYGVNPRRGKARLDGAKDEPVVIGPLAELTGISADTVADTLAVIIALGYLGQTAGKGVGTPPRYEMVMPLHGVPDIPAALETARRRGMKLGGRRRDTTKARVSKSALQTLRAWEAEQAQDLTSLDDPLEEPLADPASALSRQGTAVHCHDSAPEQRRDSALEQRRDSDPLPIGALDNRRTNSGHSGTGLLGAERPAADQDPRTDSGRPAKPLTAMADAIRPIAAPRRDLPVQRRPFDVCDGCGRERLLEAGGRCRHCVSEGRSA